MLVLRYRSSTKTTLTQDVTVEQCHSFLVAIGVGATVVGICLFVLAIIAEPDSIFKGFELYAGLLICTGFIWMIVVEAITQLRAFHAQRSAARKQAPDNEEQAAPGAYTVEGNGLECSHQEQQQQQPSPPVSLQSVSHPPNP